MCRGIDPAALQTCNLFAFVPASTVAAITQLPLAWVELYSGYLYYVAKTFGGAAFQSYVLGGPLLSPDAGGFIANKTIYEWLYGTAAALTSRVALLLSVSPLLILHSTNRMPDCRPQTLSQQTEVAWAHPAGRTSERKLSGRGSTLGIPVPAV